jgi:hypothetical protein
MPFLNDTPNLGVQGQMHMVSFSPFLFLHANLFYLQYKCTCTSVDAEYVECCLTFRHIGCSEPAHIKLYEGKIGL